MPAGCGFFGGEGCKENETIAFARRKRCTNWLEMEAPQSFICNYFLLCQPYEKYTIVHPAVATYLNRNNASVGIGAALGLGREYYSTEIIRNNNTEYHHEGRSSKSPFVYDLRIVETKVHMGKGMGMYGRLGSHSGITVGMLYTMHTRP